MLERQGARSRRSLSVGSLSSDDKAPDPIRGSKQASQRVWAGSLQPESLLDYLRDIHLGGLFENLANHISCCIQVAQHQSEVAVQSKHLNSPMGAIASMGDHLEVEMELEGDVSGSLGAARGVRGLEPIEVDEELVEKVLGVSEKC